MKVYVVYVEHLDGGRHPSGFYATEALARRHVAKITDRALRVLKISKVSIEERIVHEE